PAPPAAASSAAASSSAAVSSSARITWGKCSDPDLKKANAQCGFLKVPLDYRHPKGDKISLAVSRIKHTSLASHYQGVILPIPGVPGGSGLNLNAFLIPVPRQEGLTNGPAAAN